MRRSKHWEEGKCLIFDDSFEHEAWNEGSGARTAVGGSVAPRVASGRGVERLRMSERILIVDDDPVQRRLLDNMVRKFGYEPLVAEGGDAAVTLLTGPDGAQIDAVVLDLVM